MQQTNTKLWVRFVPLLLVLGMIVAACGDGTVDPDPNENNTPTVSISPTTFQEALPTGGSGTGGETGGVLTQDFTAVAEDVDGDSLAYIWSADSGVDLSTTSDATTTATFGTAGEFDISVEVNDGKGEDNSTASDSVTATILAPGEEPTDPPPPPGNSDPSLEFFGGNDEDSATQSDYTNDADGAPANDQVDYIVQVDPSDDTFYLLVEASDPAGVTEIGIQLRNVDTETPPNGVNNVVLLEQDQAVQGLTLGEPTDNSTDCDLDATPAPTAVTCVYPVETDGADESSLTVGEIAYVFRTVINGEEFTGDGNRVYVNTSDN